MAATNHNAAEFGVSDEPLLVALAHPLRRRILTLMMDADGPMSPREISIPLGLPLSNVSYHVVILAEQGAITLVRKDPVRGATKHLYEVTISEDWALEIVARALPPRASGNSRVDPTGPQAHGDVV